MAERDRVDLDRIVDYKAEYSAVIEKHKIHGNRLVGLCPFHRDTTDSFTADLQTGKWYCFTEGVGGNYVDFYAKFHATDTRTAFREICEKYHVEPKKSKERAARKTQGQDGGGGRGVEPYTLEQYSQDKRLPPDFLERDCRCRTDRDRDGTTFLRTSYTDESGQELTFRKRYGHKDFRWRKGSAGKIPLYGEWRLPEIREKGWAMLVEGESDTQSLWYMGFPALGVAGASLFKPEKTAALQGMRIYIHKEPDTGGETFVEKICRGLQEQNFTGQVFIWSCSAMGEKDPSDLFIKHGPEQAAAIIREGISHLQPVSLADLLTPEVIPGAPINLRTPEGWIYSDRGISAIDQKTHSPALVCRTPIILTQRLKSLETGDEKMEIAFKRDDKWSTAIFPRSTIFSSRKITDLSDLGCTITSENAKQVVRFLGALEADNIDLIPKNDATSTFGWQPGNRFMPGHADGITLDIDPSQRSMAAAYCRSGSFEDWKRIMAPHRSRDKFRFILAASFAAPLLRIIKQRIFFVYNWGGSKGGKTAALEAALSAWGGPGAAFYKFQRHPGRPGTHGRLLLRPPPRH